MQRMVLVFEACNYKPKRLIVVLRQVICLDLWFQGLMPSVLVLQSLVLLLYLLLALMSGNCIYLLVPVWTTTLMCSCPHV